MQTPGDSPRKTARVPDPALLRRTAEALEEENFDFRLFIKGVTRRSSKEIDEIVFRLEAQVWKEIDCTTCANCCRVAVPTLSEADVTRLAGHLGLSNADFAAEYLDQTEGGGTENPRIIRARPCPFLKENLCSVYEHRPDNCRGYPYLNQPDLVSRTISMMGRLPECPAVFEVWEGLKRALGFRPRTPAPRSLPSR